MSVHNFPLLRPIQKSFDAKIYLSESLLWYTLFKLEHEAGAQTHELSMKNIVLPRHITFITPYIFIVGKTSMQNYPKLGKEVETM